MHIAPVSQNQNKQSFGIKFKLPEKTVRAIEEHTRLTYEEMTTKSSKECSRLMKERGTLREPNRLFLWLQEKYKKFGEKTGLLEKRYF